MAAKFSVRQYALALFELASEQDALERVVSDIALVTEGIQMNKNLKEFIFDPEKSIEDKRAGLRDLFQDNISDYTYNFITTLLANDDLESLKAIQAYLIKLMDEREGIIEVTVISALPLSTDQKEQIENKISVNTKKKVDLKTKVDPSIIGGLVISTDNELIDASLRGKIDALRLKLKRTIN